VSKKRALDWVKEVHSHVLGAYLSFEIHVSTHVSHAKSGKVCEQHFNNSKQGNGRTVRLCPFL